MIMIESSNHLLAYSILFSMYQLLDIFHRSTTILLLLQRCMAVVRSTLCLDVHQPQSSISVERRRKRISFFFLLLFFEKEEKRGRGKGRWRANVSILFSTFSYICAQQFANLFSIAATNRTLSDVFFLLFCFAHIQVFASLEVLTLW